MKHDTVLTTKRLILRRLSNEDLPFLKLSLCDAETMYAYEHGFSDEEAREWLQRQLDRYEKDNCGLWGVVLKDTGGFIGQCGITMQPLEDDTVPEIGYVFDRRFWGHGYATEAAAGCMEYGFGVMGVHELFSIIRDSNTLSANVAKRNGMTPRGTLVKHYYGTDMPHTVWSVTREEYERFRARQNSCRSHAEDTV